MEDTMNTGQSDGQQPVTISKPSLTVVPHPEEGAPSGRLRRSIRRVMRGRRVRTHAALRMQAIEQVHIGGQRHASTTSYGENLLRALGKTAGDHVLGKTGHTMDGLADRADSMRAEQTGLRVRAGYRRGDYVRHPDGGVRTTAQTVADQDKQRAEIAADIADGSRRHRKLPRSLRRMPRIILVADGLLLLYFFSGVTNVDWSSPLSAALVFALMLAVMVTGISFAFFRLAGDRLQQYKNDAGSVPLRGLDEATMTIVALAIAAIATLATLMYCRMHAEVIDALGPSAGVTAVIIGLTLAVVSVLANTMVIAVHALDGSAQADRLEALGTVTARPLNEERRLHERADAMEQRIAVLGRRAERVAVKGITAAGHQRAAADRLIDAGRAIHQGTGPLSGPAVDPNGEDGTVGYRRTEATPAVDERPVRLALRHVGTPLAGHPQPGLPEQADEAQPAASEQGARPEQPADDEPAAGSGQSAA
jgi:protein-S-isoprenylcysteine O-methyltransferase Ste14